MAADTDDSEKTEDPTQHRMTELRKEGSIHVSIEVARVATLLVGFGMLYFTWRYLLRGMKQILVSCFTQISIVREEFGYNALKEILILIIKEVGIVLGIVFITIGIVACLSVMLQTKWNVKQGLIKFRFSQLNPIEGIKRLFSAQAAMRLITGILKLAIILPIGYFALVSYAPAMFNLIHLNTTAVLAFTGSAMMDIFWKVFYVLLALAIWDFFWTKQQWLKKNRMTKHELKDEHRSIEGDEKTKMQIRKKGLRRIQQRIAQSVPQADVVITNPTHYAIALKYDRETMAAPKVIAKGRGFMALRIREIASKARVPVLERKPLARALYASTEVGTEIPRELFKAVAEVLSYVYRLKNPYGYRQAAR